jgi:EPS-associated MarR family transcriptional regulator
MINPIYRLSSSNKAMLRHEELYFRVLHLIEQRPDASQREIAEQIGVSLGAINYCVRALLEKGHLKLANFKASKNKLGYVYVLTPDGIAQRASLAARFIARKRVEYIALQSELELLCSEFGSDLPDAAGGGRS